MKRVALAVLVLAIALPLTAQNRRVRPIRGAEPLTKVLVPFSGEEWTSDGFRFLGTLFLRNAGETPVFMWIPFACQVTCPPLEPFLMAPGSTIVDSSGGRNGSFLHLAPGSLRDLVYSLRVEDTAGLQVLGRIVHGTELPLVPQEKFAKTQTLLNIPSIGESKKILRIYGLDIAESVVDVEIYSFEFRTETLLEKQSLTLRSGNREDGYDAHPSYASADLTSIIAALAPKARAGILTITISSEKPIWAMLTMHEPADRSFTVVTPGR